MRRSTQAIINRFFNRFGVLNNCRTAVENAITKIVMCYQNNNKVLICGNGGSASDSEHIVG